MGVLRDISMILLAVEALTVMLVPAVFIGGLVYGLWWLLRYEHVPTWLRVGRTYFCQACVYVEKGMNGFVRATCAIHSAVAAVRAWLRISS